MTETSPSVAIVIATKGRPAELRLTLREMRKQAFPAVEMLVIDDGSESPIEPVVRQEWPGAVVVRHDVSVGQCTRRNEGFAASGADFILQLDDDCSFIRPGDLASAVRKMQQFPRAGALAFYVINSQILPDRIEASGTKSGCVASFLGAAVLFRKSALSQTAGYRTFFANDWEEEELGLQLLHNDWQIIFCPDIVAHHRLSAVNRNSARTWMRGLRNRLWAMMIHIPLRRLPLEMGWKVMLGGWDALRLLRFGYFCQALTGLLGGASTVWRLRKPLSELAMRRYDALRLHPVLTFEEFENPPAVNSGVLRTFLRRWANRARNRSVWDANQSDVGTSYTVAYAHELSPPSPRTAVPED